MLIGFIISHPFIEETLHVFRNLISETSEWIFRYKFVLKTKEDEQT